MKTSPLEYHGPGWKAEDADHVYWVWAPREGRPGWAACYESHDGVRGDFRRAETLDEALKAFSKSSVRTAFRKAASTIEGIR